MKNSRMEKHKQLRNKIAIENNVALEFVQSLDRDINESLKILYLSFPKVKKIVDEKLEKKYDFENKTFIVSKSKKNIKLTKKPDMSKIDELKNKIESYKHNYSLVDENIQNNVDEMIFKIKKQFSPSYVVNKENLVKQKQLLEDVSLSNIEKIRNNLHRILILMIDNADNKSIDLLNQLKIEYEENKKELKLSLKSGDDIGNTIVDDLDKLQGIEKSLKFSSNFKWLKFGIVLINILIIVGVGVWLWLILK